MSNVINICETGNICIGLGAENFVCHLCRNPAECYCEDCKKPVCSDCLAGVTQRYCAEYNQCEECADNH